MATKLMVIFLVLGLCNIVALAIEEESELLNTLDESQPGWKLLNDEKEYNLAEVYKLLEKQLEHGADSKANELVEKLLDLNVVIPSKCNPKDMTNVANLLKGNYWKSAKSNSLKDYTFDRANDRFDLCHLFLRGHFESILKHSHYRTKRMIETLIKHLLGASLSHYEFLLAKRLKNAIDDPDKEFYPIQYYQSLDHLMDRRDVLDMAGATMLYARWHGIDKSSVLNRWRPDFFEKKFNKFIAEPCTELTEKFAAFAPLYSNFMVPGTVAYDNEYNWEIKLALDFCDKISERNESCYTMYQQLYR